MTALNGTQLIADYLTPSLTSTSIVGVEWLIAAVVILLTLLTITRDYGKWPRLGLPVAIMWHVVGLNVGIVLMIVTAFIWVMDVLSLDVLQKGILAIGMNSRQEKQIQKEARTQLLRKSVKKGIAGKIFNKKGEIVNTLSPTEEVIYKEFQKRQKNTLKSKAQKLKEKIKGKK